MMNQAMDYLNTVDIASLPVDAQVEVLTSLAAMKPQHAAAAQAVLLAAFAAGGGPEADGQGAGPGRAALAERKCRWVWVGSN
jgi:hypothetical protein